MYNVVQFIRNKLKETCSTLDELFLFINFFPDTFKTVGNGPALYMHTTWPRPAALKG